MPETKYSWNWRITWVVEMVRNDAEISLDLDGVRLQKVIMKGCSSREMAEKIAVDFCQKIATQITEGIRRGVTALADAKE